MVEQEIVITKEASDITVYINRGWVVKTIVAQHVSVGGSWNVEGKFCFLLEREK